MSAPKKIYYDDFTGKVNREWMVGDTTYIREDLVDELVEALEECAIDLKEWILGRYPEESLKYPSIKKDFELDISIVDKAFATLAKARGESHE